MRLLSFIIFSLVFSNVLAWDDKCSAHKTAQTIFSEGRVLDVVFAKPDYQVVFALLSDTTVYRSGNGGKSWTMITDVQADEIIPTANPTMFFFLHRGNISTTSDKGKSFKTLNTTGYFELEAHPTNANYALVSHRVCKGFNCRTNMLVTDNFGTSWKVIVGTVSQYSWGNAGKNGIPETNIHYVWAPDSDTNDEGSLVYTYSQSSDLAKTTIHSVPYCVGMLFTNDLLFVAQEQYMNDLSLLVSDSNGTLFKTAEFPFVAAALTEKRYSILDTTGGAAFINVDHSADGFWGHTYVADSFLAPDFTLALPYNRRGYMGKVDFARVKGVDGVYLANRWAVDEFDTHSVPKGTALETVITFNSGATWSSLGKPTGVTCTKNCQLNLIGGGNGMGIPSYYSSSKAVGLIIASGLTDKSIDDVQADELDTYFSNDAGQTWSLIKKGSYLYQFLDHGGVITLLDYLNQTASYSYSWNEGLSWHDCPLGDTKVQVKSIKASPAPTGLSLLVLGETTNPRKGVITWIDFSDLHDTECKPSDYEDFSPHGNVCLLGQKFTYKRRQRGKECFNGNNYEEQSTPTPCPCTANDFDCDYCHERVGSSCVAIWNCNYPEQDCNNGRESYLNQTGYRLAPRNKCNPNAQGAVNLLPKIISCSTKSSGSKAVVAIVVIMVLLALLVASIVVVIYLRKTNENFRERTDPFFERVSSLFVRSSTGRGAGHYSSVNKHEGEDMLDDEDVDGPKELDDETIATYTKPASNQGRSGEEHI